MNILDILNDKLVKIFDKLEFDKKYAFFQYSDRPDLSDFQTNCAMPLCKIIKKSPRDVANLIVPELEATGLFEKITVDGPGFINVVLKNNILLKNDCLIRFQNIGECGEMGLNPDSIRIIKNKLFNLNEACEFIQARIDNKRVELEIKLKFF